MSASQDVPQPPTDATDRELELWKELINRIHALKTGQRETVTDNAQFSEGDQVDTPDGVGVVFDVLTETVEGDDQTVDASDDSPTYAVGVEDESVGVGFYKASELSSTTIETDVDNPEGELDEETANAFRQIANALGLTSNNFRPPESWRESSTPNRVIALKAFAGMGGSFDGCVREMRGSIASPDRFCGSFLDYVIGNPYWRGDSPLPGA